MRLVGIATILAAVVGLSTFLAGCQQAEEWPSVKPLLFEDTVKGLVREYMISDEFVRQVYVARTEERLEYYRSTLRMASQGTMSASYQGGGVWVVSTKDYSFQVIESTQRVIYTPAK